MEAATGLPKDLCNLISEFARTPDSLQTEEDHKYWANVLELKMNKLWKLFLELSSRYHQYALPGLKNYIERTYKDTFLMTQGAASDLACYQFSMPEFLTGKKTMYEPWFRAVLPKLTYVKRNASGSLDNADAAALRACMEEIIHYQTDLMSAIRKTDVYCMNGICGHAIKQYLYEFADKWLNQHGRAMLKLFPN